MPRTRLLIADDATLVRKLLAKQLAMEPDVEVVGEAVDGRSAVEQALSLRPDLVLMDLSMPHLNGAEATERILQHLPHVKVIMLTAHEDLGTLGRLSGAFECLSKNCTLQELLATLRRARAAQKEAAAAGPGAAPPDHRQKVERLAIRAALTDRERAVIERALDPERTLRQIAHELSQAWQEEVTESSVKHALERGLNKLRVEPRTRAALVRHVLESRA